MEKIAPSISSRAEFQFAIRAIIFSVIFLSTMFPPVFLANAGISDLFLIVVSFYLLLFKRQALLILNKSQVRLLLIISVGWFTWLIVSNGFEIEAVVDGVKDLAGVSFLALGFVLCTNLKENDVRFIQHSVALGVIFQSLLNVRDYISESWLDWPRAMGTFTNPNHSASWLAICILFLVTTKYLHPRKSRIIPITFGFIGLILTNGLGSLLALICALAWLRADKAHNLKNRSLGYVLGAVAAVVLTLFASFAFPFLANSPTYVRAIASETEVVQKTPIIMEPSSARVTDSATSRFKLWQISLENFIENPLNPKPVVIQWTPEFEPTATEPHNEVLGFMVSGGIVGLAYIVSFYTIIFRNCSIAYRHFASFFVVSGLAASVFTYRWVMLMLGLAMAFSYSSIQNELDNRKLKKFNY